MADDERLGNLKKMDTILHKMQDSAQELINLDSEYGTYNTEELKADIDNMIYWLEQEIQHFGDYEASTKKSKQKSTMESKTKSFNSMVKSIRVKNNKKKVL